VLGVVGRDILKHCSYIRVERRRNLHKTLQRRDRPIVFDVIQVGDGHLRPCGRSREREPQLLSESAESLSEGRWRHGHSEKLIHAHDILLLRNKSYVVDVYVDNVGA
jgi:hypothetical protein